MNERKVKGTMLVDLVRMIRKNKDKNWEPHFTPEEWKVINSKIMDSGWYSLTLYKKCAETVLSVLAAKNHRIVRARGRERAKELFNGIYKPVILKDEPFQCLKRFVLMYGMLFNFSTVKAESLGSNHAQVHHDFDDFDHDNGTAYCHQLMGVLEALLELSGARNIKISLTAKQWEQAPVTTFDLQWA